MTDVDGQKEMFGGANVSALEDGDILASLSAWARMLGIERETLRRRLVDAGVQSKGEKRGHAVYGGRDVWRAWLASDEARVDPDSMTPFNRRAWYQGEHEKLRLQQERGELVPALEVEQTMGALAKQFVLGLDTLIDVIERDVGLTPMQAKRLERHIDRLREELYESLVPAADTNETPAAAKQAKQAKEPKAKPAPAPAGSAVEEAAAFLQAAVAGGPRPTAELVAEAKAAGISEGSLRRAKAQLGKAIIAKREGRGWVWAAASGDAPVKKRKSRKR